MILLTDYQHTEGIDVIELGVETAEIRVTQCSFITVFASCQEDEDPDVCVFKFDVFGSNSKEVDAQLISDQFYPLSDESISADTFKTYDVKGFCWIKVVCTKKENESKLVTVNVNCFSE